VETHSQSHIVNEKKALMEVNHPFIIRLHATYKSADKLFFLLEPGLGGELFRILRKRSTFPEPTARFYAACVISAFEHMHSKDIIFRDLKPENLLLDSEGYLKVTDFGFAKKIASGKTWTLCGTPEYLSPEIVGNKGHGKGVDWWTVGILIFEMLSGFTPFYHEDSMQMYQLIAKGKITFPKHLGPDARSLITGLLQLDPTKRLGVIQGGAATIKSHPWFTSVGFDWAALVARRMPPPIVPAVRSASDLSNFAGMGAVSDEVRSYTDDGTGWDKEF